jgi:hypothetical protein
MMMIGNETSKCLKRHGGLIMDETIKRTRMNVSITAKGQAQWDVTTEYASPEDTAKNLSEAIDKVRQIIKGKGLVEAGSV